MLTADKGKKAGRQIKMPVAVQLQPGIDRARARAIDRVVVRTVARQRRRDPLAIATS